LKEWRKIEKRYEGVLSRREVKRLEGFLYEALFYYACLEAQTVFLDAELAEFGGAEFKGSPPWFECVPLYDNSKPPLHSRWGKEEEESAAGKSGFPSDLC